MWAEQAEQLAADAYELGTDAGFLHGAAYLARVDPAAMASLVHAALALGAPPASLMRSARALPHDLEMLARTADLETCAGEMLKRAEDLLGAVSDGLDAASDAAAAATRALAAAKTAPETSGAAEILGEARARIADCECALEILADLGPRLTTALACLENVPDDLEETYQVPYGHIRRGGRLPNDGDFLTGVPA